MKRFKEMIAEGQSPEMQGAIYWCDSRIRFYPEEQWLQWCRNRFSKEFLLDVEGLYLEGYYRGHEELYTYAEFVEEVVDMCRAYYFMNGGEMTQAEKRLSEKMNSESLFMQATPKKNPDTSPDKIQLELEDGVAYISKKSGWVLSQF
ncbi:hypothetical protein EFB08_18715 [Rufibacter latericius]|uniref:Uncharacterized protein n=2 Tax=Rufibacter latericius TaxID=2487040 RepID=A0A3M9MDI3_9BACT|nr:hypothetical protein EFB08_18715 [Rufibacter latericius]